MGAHHRPGRDLGRRGSSVLSQRRGLQAIFLVSLLASGGCATGQEAPEAAPAAPAPAPSTALAELTQQGHFGDRPLQISVRIPEGGVEQARKSVRAGIQEVARINAQLRAPGLDEKPSSEPDFELQHVRANFPSLLTETAHELGHDQPIPLDRTGALKAYTLDQVAELLRRDGITDFLIDAGDLRLARGSQAPGTLRGWRVAPDGFPAPPVEVLVLEDEALATHLDTEATTAVVAPSATGAWLGAQAVHAAGALDTSESGPASLHYKRTQHDGAVVETDGFTSRTEVTSP